MCPVADYATVVGSGTWSVDVPICMPKFWFGGTSRIVVVRFDVIERMP